MTTRKAVVLLSGGIDSTTTLAIANSEGYEVYALSFNYGQRHSHELEAAKRIAEYFGVKEHLIMDIDLRAIGGSALTSETEVPKKSAEVLIPVTYVPARNTIFLSFALAWAEVINAEDIFMGANVIDYSGYPDCRPEYIEAFEKMANLATKAGVEGKMRFRIRTPLISLTKAEIIKKGIELGVDYSITWSCYDPQPATPSAFSLQPSAFVPCCRCDSCILRAKGFKEAGVNDPLLSSL
ncbi:MAG: 7-cyano-7-deazaguanine synthase QueC [Nitrospirota bacterium]